MSSGAMLTLKKWLRKTRELGAKPEIPQDTRDSSKNPVRPVVLAHKHTVHHEAASK